jgi:hypothetical protein
MEIRKLMMRNVFFCFLVLNFDWILSKGLAVSQQDFRFVKWLILKHFLKNSKKLKYQKNGNKITFSNFRWSRRCCGLWLKLCSRCPRFLRSSVIIPQLDRPKFSSRTLKFYVTFIESAQQLQRHEIKFKLKFRHQKIKIILWV